ncbi:uracil-DNA glycosylase [Paenibacillus oryzae]|uniref:Uracil-DNA glycosylase n=1 Tax=Paenibacillus oryzae TaxID=1844972 RepID=A0A1A5YK19_9BACL|nr:uracil-DNA glycosylase [Paenibacillus oryzae]OBR65908.1 uracil-DNA glycosylase [Paenibacillus oryzae]
MAILRNDWAQHLENEFQSDYYIALRQFLIEEYKSRRVYPDMYDIFNALHETPFAETRVVILGQDPYHGAGQAHGLSFSVKPGVTPPPSLQNIFKELHDDIGCPIPSHGHLLEWARQGVLLLNTVLTVRAGSANSHRDKGWEVFTDTVIDALNRKTEPVVFILWGSHAQKKADLITNRGHYLIKSPHPSPYSADRGFFGSRPFSRANQFLADHGLTQVNWRLPQENEMKTEIKP